MARTLLTSNTTYNVGASDNPQDTINLIRDTIDLGGYTATIQLAASTTYTTPLKFYAFTGYGSIVVDGAGSTIYTTGDYPVASYGGAISQTVIFQNIKFERAGTVGIPLVIAQTPCYFVMGTGVTFGWASGASHMSSCSPGAIIQITSNYTITGDANIHMFATCNGLLTGTGSPITITASGTRTFYTSFARASDCGVIFAPALSFSGTFHGPRYSVDFGAIDGTGGGANYFPGNSAGYISGNGGKFS